MTAVNNKSFTERQLVTFLLGEDEFGTDIMNVKEIIRVPDITKVPNAPYYVEGASNLRGYVLPIIDGRTRFNMTKKIKDESSRVLVIDVDGKAIGVVVDKVSEVIRVHEADIEKTPQIVKNVDSDYLEGVVKLDNGNRLIMLLDLLNALSVENIEIDGEKEQNASVHKNNATDTSAGILSTDAEQLVSFILGKEEYAIGIKKVKEIIRVPEIVKVPNCEAYIEGVASIRNNLLPIINLRTYFGLEQIEINDQTRILVVDMDDFSAGIMVDKSSEVLRVPLHLIQPPPRFSAQCGELLKGVAKLDNGARMIMILDQSKLISVDDIITLSKSEQNANDISIAKQIREEERLVIFKVDSEEYGIKIANVQEIRRMTQVTKVPRAPDYIEGIVNLRGNAIPAMNVRKFFKLPEKQVTDATRIVITNMNDKKIGIVVDSVSEVIKFEKALIEATPNILSNGIDSDYIEGVGKLDNGRRMILLPDIKKILGSN